MVHKKASHELRPMDNHTEWATDDKVKKGYMAAVGLGDYVNAHADDETFQKAMGPEVEDPTFTASMVKPTTEGAIKQAQKAVKDVLKANLPPPKPVWSGARMGQMNTVWRKEITDDADTAMQSTMQIPSGVVIPHVASGSAPRPKPRPANKRPAEGEGSGTAGKRIKKNKQTN